MLRSFEDLPSREIASTLQIHDRAVRFRLMVARHRLRRGLGEVLKNPADASNEPTKVKSKFRSIGESARLSIAVPETPFATIRDAAQQRSSTNKRSKRVTAGSLAGVVVLGGAAAAELWKGTHVSFGSSGTMRPSTVEVCRLKEESYVGRPAATSLDARRSRFSFQQERRLRRSVSAQARHAERRRRPSSPVSLPLRD